MCCKIPLQLIVADFIYFEAHFKLLRPAPFIDCMVNVIAVVLYHFTLRDFCGTKETRQHTNAAHNMRDSGHSNTRGRERASSRAWRRPTERFLHAGIRRIRTCIIRQHGIKRSNYELQPQQSPPLLRPEKHLPALCRIFCPAKQGTRSPAQQSPHAISKFFQVLKTHCIIGGDGEMGHIADCGHIVPTPRIEHHLFHSQMRTCRVVIHKHHAPFAFAARGTYRNIGISNRVPWLAPAVASIKYANHLVEGRVPQIKTPEPRGQTKHHSQRTFFWRPCMIADMP